MNDAQFVTLFSELFPEKPEMTGWTISAIGVGALLAVLILTKKDTIERHGWFFGSGSVMIGVMAGGFGFLTSASPLTIGLLYPFIGGMGTGITLTVVNYMIQKEHPREAVGRVSGIVDSKFSILFIVGPILGGVQIQHLGVLVVFRWIGVLLLLTGVSRLSFIRQFGRRKILLQSPGSFH